MDDVLVLEVGGDRASLRASLVALGRLPESASREPSEGRPEETPPVHDQGAPVQAEPGVEENGVEENGAPVAPPPEPEWVSVPLPPGETLTDLARRHLGDGRRFVDLLKWNGWSEQDARRLRDHQMVKIRRAEMR